MNLLKNVLMIASAISLRGTSLARTLVPEPRLLPMFNTRSILASNPAMRLTAVAPASSPTTGSRTSLAKLAMPVSPISAAQSKVQKAPAMPSFATRCFFAKPHDEDAGTITILARPISLSLKIGFSEPTHLAIKYKGIVRGVTGEGVRAMFRKMQLGIDPSDRHGTDKTIWAKTAQLHLGKEMCEKIMHDVEENIKHLDYDLFSSNCYTPILEALVDNWQEIKSNPAISDETKEAYKKIASDIITDNAGFGTIRVLAEHRDNLAELPLTSSGLVTAQMIVDNYHTFDSPSYIA